MDNSSLELRTAIEAAKKGAVIALSYYNKGKDLSVSLKKDTSTLTIADTDTEDVIKNHILSVYPNAEFIAEESGNTTSNFENVWIIDPIDGTTEFSRGIDLWGIMVAYASKKKWKLVSAISQL